MYQLLWTFFVYAFLGWCAEVCFTALNSGRIVNRGMLNGPVCPIYGFGVTLVLYCLTPLKDNFLLLFAGATVLTSVLEGLTGLALEKLFHQRWWDYSDQPFNLGGYICPKFSVVWGLACLIVVDVIHPTIAFLIQLIPTVVGWSLIGVLSAAMLVDVGATVRTISQLNHRITQLDEMAAKLRGLSDDMSESLAEKALDAAEKGADAKEEFDALVASAAKLRPGETWQARQAQKRAAAREELEEWRERFHALLEENTFGQRRLLAAFPKMRSIRHNGALERLRRHVREKEERSRRG